MSNLQIPIVVVAYNRLHSLKRILSSLDRCIYPEQVKLIISIDGGGTQDVIDLATSFDWQHGKKAIICHDDNLGLREHILKCGQLALKYDGIVLLEDDLYVSPYFYQFMLAAQNQYMNDKNISGIALYSPRYTETACLPFTPIADGNDVFFMQLACSWGQSWLSQQWQDFETWYADHKDLILQHDTNLPPNIQLWPDSSWKKYFIKYNIENNKFFAYPRFSFTTNFADSGVNHTQTKLWQVPISRGNNSSRLPDFDKSIAKYDAFCELLPGILKKLAPTLEKYDFTVDLYGVRGKEAIDSKYVLSRNEFSNHLLSFGCEIKPHELNIIDGIEGDHFKLGLKEDMIIHGSFLGHRYRIFTDYEETQKFFYAMTPEHLSVFAKDTCKAWEEEQNLIPLSSDSVNEDKQDLKVESTEFEQHSKELCADIEYLKSAVSWEMVKFSDRFRQIIRDQPSRDIKLSLVVNEVSGSLAKLSTKINMIEKVISHSELARYGGSKDESPLGPNNLHYLPEIRITASELAKYNNMESLEQSENGIDYCWTGPDEDFEFILPFQRDTAYDLTIRLYSLIKPSFGKALKIFADGKHVKHIFRLNEGLFIVTCRLPPIQNSRKASIRISLPGTFSPKELGLSEDQRKLGIAINEIHIGIAGSRYYHLLRQMRLK